MDYAAPCPQRYKDGPRVTFDRTGSACWSGFHGYKGYAQFGFDFLNLLQLIGAERGWFKVMALKSQQDCSQFLLQTADGLKR
jgi:hypothetical protein